MTRSSSQDFNECTATTQEEILEDVQITQSTNTNLVEQILLNPQSLSNRARTPNSKVANVLKKNGVLSMTKFLRDLLPQKLNAVAALCVSCHTLGLVNKKDVLDCIETISVIGVLVHTCLGK
jgi:hypothetical protein